MKRRRGTIGLVLAAICLTAYARADRDIIYAAENYRRSGHFYKDRYGGQPEAAVVSAGSSHLYRINPNGAGRTQLTFGSQNDALPLWSSGGRWIVFMREYIGGAKALCRIRFDGGSVRKLAVLTEGDLYFGVISNGKRVWLLRIWKSGRALLSLIDIGAGRLLKHVALTLPKNAEDVDLECSSDGRRAALTYEDFGRRTLPNALYLIDIRSGRMRKFPGVGDMAWSPDGRRLFLRYRESARILNVITGETITADLMKDPTWLDSRTLVGDMPVRDNADNAYVGEIGFQGRESRRVRLKPTLLTEGDSPFTDSFYPRSRTWLSLEPTHQILLASSYFGTNYGGEFSCSRVDLKIGSWHTLSHGMLLALSPDRQRLVVADYNYWIGNHGRERLGPLQIVSVRTGRTQAITSRLLRVWGADWRGSVPVRHVRAIKFWN